MHRHGWFTVEQLFASVSYSMKADTMTSSELSLQEAADKVIMEKLVAQGATGGIVAQDAAGKVAMVFNTPGMYRARIGVDGRLFVGIYRDED